MVLGRTPDYVDVAAGQPAFQSSMSQWSLPDDARRAVCGQPIFPYAFHTQVETAPFWFVDLQAPHRVRRIVIQNRSDECAARAVPLYIEVSLTGTEWTLLSAVHYVFGCERSGEPLVLDILGGLDARYVRLRRTGETQAFHLAQVQVFAAVEEFSSAAQLRQDLWVMRMTAGRRGGVFVDIGASDGKEINNTWLLEKRLGWTGLCVEPNPNYFHDLIRNRAAQCFQRAVFPTDGAQLTFLPCAELGTLVGFEDADSHAAIRRSRSTEVTEIVVETISPTELLRQAALPTQIDYLSIDTEGSEWEIIRSFDFTATRFGLLTVEHNFVEDKRRFVSDFLAEHGYVRVPVQFDDWFYHPDHLEALNGSVRVDYAAICQDFADRAA